MTNTLAPRLGLGLLVLSALGLGLFLGTTQPVAAGPAAASVPGVAPDQLPAGSVGAAAPQAHTVYLDGSGGKKRAARHMTQLHQVMAAKGWTFAHLAPHVENADLQGWWITYVAR